MKALILFLGLFSIQAHASLKKPCEVSLESSKLELSIGALVESPDGKLYLGLSSYLNSKHSRVIDNLSHLHGVRRILWMGELRYHISADGQLLLTEANETSGLYNDLKDGKNLEGIEHVENHVDNLPRSLRAPGFKSWQYDDNNLHLMTELNGLKDLRHDLGSSFQLVVNAVLLLKSPVDRQKTTRFLSRFKGERNRDIRLIRWVIHHVVDSRRVTDAELSELKSTLKYLEDGDGDRIAGDVDVWQVREQVWLLSSLIGDLSPHADVDIFKVNAD